MAAKRTYGQGSIYRRRDGRWEARIEIDPGPPRRRKAVYGASRREVERKLAAIREDHRKGNPLPDERRTVNQLLDAWLVHVQELREPRTHRAYQDRSRYIRAGLGQIRLTRLTVKHVDDWLAELRTLRRGDGPSAPPLLKPRYIWELRNTLRTALNRAIRWEWLSRNVAALADAEMGDPYEPTALTGPQALTFLESVQGHRWEALWVLSLAMGLRENEALGLRWEDVDFEAGVLHIRGQLARVDGELKHKSRAKTTHSRQALLMPEPVAESLHQRKATQLRERMLAGTDWSDTGFVFTARTGRPLIARNMVREFKLLLTRARLADGQPANLPAVRFHDLRHSTSSLLAFMGIGLHARRVLLRHTTQQQTAEYTHVYRAELEAVAQAMTAFLRQRRTS